MVLGDDDETSIYVTIAAVIAFCVMIGATGLAAWTARCDFQYKAANEAPPRRARPSLDPRDQ